MKILLAAFYTPGIRSIEYLLQEGLAPTALRLITHNLDRNAALLAIAKEHGVQTFTSSIKSADAYNWVNEFQPDVLFSFYFRDIIPPTILRVPRLGSVNLHPALLPKYRGTFSIPWTIINGEELTGFTYHRMVAEVDAGDVILQRTVLVRPNDTAFSLYHRLVIEGCAHFGEAFDLVIRGFPGTPQTGESSYYPRKVPFNGEIDPTWGRSKVDRFIRAMYFPPFRGAVVRLKNHENREVLTLAEYDALLEEGQLGDA